MSTERDDFIEALDGENGRSGCGGSRLKRLFIKFEMKERPDFLVLGDVGVDVGGDGFRNCGSEVCSSDN